MYIISKSKKIIPVLYIFIFSMFTLNINSVYAEQAVEKPENIYKVYLTFDDGPSRNTEKVLDVLQSYDVKATFFVIGQTDDYELSLYERIIDEGHALGLHSYTHNTGKIYASASDYIQDFERLRNWIFKSTGIFPKFCRMVGGSNSRLCCKETRAEIICYFNDNGYACYDWDIDPLDSGSYALDSNTIAKNVINAAKKKPEQDLVILMHDDNIRKTLPAALEIIIPYFSEQGYSFDVLNYNTVLNNSRALVNN